MHHGGPFVDLVASSQYRFEADIHGDGDEIAGLKPFCRVAAELTNASDTVFRNPVGRRNRAILHTDHAQSLSNRICTFFTLDDRVKRPLSKFHGFKPMYNNLFWVGP